MCNSLGGLKGRFSLAAHVVAHTPPAMVNRLVEGLRGGRCSSPALSSASVEFSSWELNSVHSAVGEGLIKGLMSAWSPTCESAAEKEMDVIGPECMSSNQAASRSLAS
eukprot:6707959-Pyramimonas_sp.AAC.2